MAPPAKQSECDPGTGPDQSEERRWLDFRRLLIRYEKDEEELINKLIYTATEYGYVWHSASFDNATGVGEVVLRKKWISDS